MILVRLIEFLRSRLNLVLRVCYALLALLVILDTVPGLVARDGKAHSWLEAHLPGFWAIYGLAGCILLILASKAFGHLGIMQPEDYYDE